MAFRAGKTGARQTAVNAASTVVSALISAGEIQLGDVKAELTTLRDELFADLETFVEDDNKVFEAAEKSAPKRSTSSDKRSSGSRNGGGGDRSITADSAREVELTWGKFKGVTLGELESMSAEDTEEYGYEKSGLDYLKYLSRNDNNEFMAKRASAILKTRRSASDEDEG